MEDPIPEQELKGSGSSSAPDAALIASLYREAATSAFHAFKETALSHVRNRIPFDAAVWGSGIFSENRMLGVTFVDFPPEKLLAYADGWQGEDYIRTSAVARPGVALRMEDLMSREAYEQTDIYLRYSKPAGIEHALGIARHEAVTDLGDMIFLFRNDRTQPFSDAERDLLQICSVHLGVAWEQAQILHHYRSLAEGSLIGSAEPRSHAICDDQGLLHAAGDLFCHALKAVAPRWTGPRLPPMFAPLLKGSSQQASGVGISFAARRHGDHFLLSALPDRLVPGLTGAESRVVRLYASGLSQPRIAADLGVSAATVRNQLASAYQKLGVHSKIELVRTLNRAADPTPANAV